VEDKRRERLRKEIARVCDANAQLRGLAATVSLVGPFMAGLPRSNESVAEAPPAG
jgi:hypothetical protein